MRNFLILIIFISIYGCNKPKTVFICGDHKCVNKAEAEQFFEENLSLEVKIIDKKKDNSLSLVELNLENVKDGKKSISISEKKETNEIVKVLSNDEIERKKADIKEKNKLKKKIKNNKKKMDKKNQNIKKSTKPLNDINKKDEIVDICKLIEECNIENISKFLVQQGIKKNYPDITVREN